MAGGVAYSVVFWWCVLQGSIGVNDVGLMMVGSNLTSFDVVAGIGCFRC